MCGIFGIYQKSTTLSKQTVYKVLVTLARESETRGKEASGFCFANSTIVNIGKTSHPVSWLINTSHFKNAFQQIYDNQNQFSLYFGHARLVTHGYEHFAKNNQPVQAENLIIVHNGIVINYKQIWSDYLSDIKPQTELDTEVIPYLFRKYRELSSDCKTAINKMFMHIKGVANIALFEPITAKLILASNNGSLYFYENNKFLVFASEKRIIKNALTAGKIKTIEEQIKQITASESVEIGLNGIEPSFFSSIETTDIDAIYKQRHFNTSLEHANDIQINQDILLHLREVKDRISILKRCTRCILPESFPGITYNENGVCSVCQTYPERSFKGNEKLISDIHQMTKNKPILVAFSGGRDSSYALHYIKKELGFKCIAYSYDWGMLTDLGRRNQSLMCAELGVEHILVSADIRKKRRNIHLNVKAWLRNPSLGMIPLFMAGDKQYFYHAYKLMKELDTPLLIMGENYLEKTGFKTAFSGAKQTDAGYMAYHISPTNKLRMIAYYLGQYISSPLYLNSSLWDTLGAATSYYGLQHNYINLFNYIPWCENKINHILVNMYNWETDPETQSTWRIGDGTAAFYNYIYYVVAGFSEIDTFCSNQIREGLITREDAIKKNNEENTPRWNSIKWYCDTIGIDFETTIKRINQIKKRY